MREAAVWAEVEAEKARQRQADAARQTNALLGRVDATLVPKLEQASENGKTDAKVAEKVGMKKTTYQKAAAANKKPGALANLS